MKVTPYVTPYVELSVSQPFTCVLVAVGCGLMAPLCHRRQPTCKPSTKTNTLYEYKLNLVVLYLTFNRLFFYMYFFSIFGSVWGGLG